MAAHPGADATTFAPFVVHPLAPLNFDAQIPKKGDQRQMEDWQRIGVYAAGLALDSAGVKGKSDILSHMDMIVAAGGGERDLNVDAAILSGMRGAADPAAFLNERLMSDLRPTLFLAQLSNLLAGNISIVHGVTGSSRTFMGEESAGVDAVRIALARIAAGQSEIALVGGSYNGERPDLLMLYEFDRLRAERALRPGVGARRTRRRRPWFARRFSGAGSARARAGARRKAAGAARPPCWPSAASARPAPSPPGLPRLWDKIKAKVTPGQAAVLSGASGAEPATKKNAPFSPPIPSLPCAQPGPISGMGRSRNSS